ncbi:hypothetical protein [Hymenobacter sp. HDW8]|uniref:hypothetical protein n=1 Tax=Hymenobacter sp. HDW8 TaxID=2714932 RepID=UPI001408EE34|nr:hypothetical protein [Hymenobacter sp. HDW8]QIL75553.1 hypothetical protein G7064_06615 [Hymenobacter sp. HDW8]
MWLQTALTNFKPQWNAGREFGMQQAEKKKQLPEAALNGVPMSLTGKVLFKLVFIPYIDSTQFFATFLSFHLNLSFYA